MGSIMSSTAPVAQRYAAASKATRELVDQLLEQDAATAAVAAQIGPALSQGDAARLLGVSVQAVSKNKALLKHKNPDGRAVYPIVQFAGRNTLPGLGEVLHIFDGILEPLTVASWLTLPRPELDERTPATALRVGDVDAVLPLARRAATAAAA